jgi:hypothetical protein
MDKGDFFIHFVDGSEDILEMQTQQVTIEKVESYLEMAIRTSSTNSDPFKDDVCCELNLYGIRDQLIITNITRGAFGGNVGQNSAGAQMNLNNFNRD